MKNKIRNVFVIFTLLISFFFNNIYGSTNTEERTENDLKIRDSIEINSTVKNAALRTPKVNENEKIYDFANLLTDEEELSLYLDITNFINTHNLDMVVVTIDENNKYSSMVYADDFYDYNYFGKGKTYDGLLMLIDMDNREVWISTTGQAILIYDDYRIDNMLDYIQPNLTNENYNRAVENFIEYSSKYASEGTPSSNKLYYIDENGKMQKKQSAIYVEALQSAAIFSMIITGIFIIIGVCIHKNVKKAKQANYYLDKNSVNITGKEDNFINSHTTKTYDPPSSSSSSSGGGSSSHSSSSGSSHGGGGRSF